MQISARKAGVTTIFDVSGDIDFAMCPEIRRAVILTHGDELQVPIAELNASHSRVFAPASAFEQAERNVIIDALKAASGQISGRGGAKRLGLKRTTLQNKMRKLNINRVEYVS